MTTRKDNNGNVLDNATHWFNIDQVLLNDDGTPMLDSDGAYITAPTNSGIAYLADANTQAAKSAFGKALAAATDETTVLVTLTLNTVGSKPQVIPTIQGIQKTRAPAAE